MQNVAGVWSGLETRQRITVALAAAAMFAAILWLSRLAMQPDLALLYAGLEGAAAADVVAALEQRSVPYEVRGDAVYAPRSERDALRIALAGEGLPQNGAAGYELLDGLSGFGTTSQMFDAAYWRAKEGELARTMTASPQVRAARVHISNPSSRPFRRDSAPSASVFVTPAGASLTPEQAQALRYLVASAVARLEADAVSVIDAASGTVIEGRAENSVAEMEAERATELQRAVERLLEARVGPGRAVVEVRIEPQTDRESIVERRFDPDGRVAVATETEERNSSAQGPSEGAVTVASDLPDGDAAEGAGQRSSQETETRERTNFEVSETQREVVREPGGIRRLTVAVLVDGTRETQPDGSEVWAPRSDEELADMRDLVASAVGFDEARGDEITIKTLPFERFPADAEGSLPAQRLPLDMMRLAQLGVLAAVVLALGLLVVRPILTGRRSATPAPQDPQDGPAGTPALTGEIADNFAAPTMNTVSDFDFDLGAGGGAMGAGEEDPVSRLKALIAERQEETMEVLQSWMSDKADRA